jgi:hypothetical protein
MTSPRDTGVSPVLAIISTGETPVHEKRLPASQMPRLELRQLFIG